MIVTMRDVTTNQVATRLERLRVEGGAVALGRVLTLVIVLDTRERLTEAIDAADAASLEHPCRVLALCPRQDAGAGEGRGIDAEIRVGADAGASETVILTIAQAKREDLDALLNPLLLSDAPIVAWWPGQSPAVPAADPVGAMATRRIVDSFACADPISALHTAARGYRPGDTDLSWTRITLWRAQLAAAFEEVAGVAVDKVSVAGNPRHPSCHLLLGWLSASLGAPGELIEEPDAFAITAARIHWRPPEGHAGDDGTTGAPAAVVAEERTDEGRIELVRPEGQDVAVLRVGSEIPHDVALQMRTLPECLAEELRRLDPDEVYGRIVSATLAAEPFERELDRTEEGRSA